MTNTKPTASSHTETHIRLVLFESYYYVYHGNSRYMLLLAKHLDPTRFATQLVVAGDGPLADEARRQALPIEIVAYPPELARFGREMVQDGLPRLVSSLYHLIQYNLTLRKLLIRLKTDIVHCTSTRSLLSAGLAAKLAGAKLCWVVQMEYANPLLDTLAMVLADRIIFISERLQRQRDSFLLDRFKHKIRLIPFGVDLPADLTDGTPYRAELGLASDVFVVGVTASVVPLKGLHYLIESIHVLRKRGIPIICLIVGGTPSYGQAYEQQLRDRIHTLDIASLVRFIGWREDANRIISALDLYVLPSLSEGLSRSTVEAMWQAKPVVVSDTGAMADLVDDSVGRLIPKGDVRALADAIEYFYRHPEERLTCGQRGRQRVMERYSLATHIAHMDALFTELLN